MKLNFKIYGEGFPILIMHGLLGSLDNWQSVAKSLAEENMIITIDLRNHGRSMHSPVFNYQAMVDDVLAFLEEQHIFRTHVLGHSMGGKVAMYFALQNADFVEKLIVADIAPIQYIAHHEDVFKGLSAVPLPSIQSRQEAETILAAYLKEESVIQFLMKGLYRKDDNQFSWRFNLNDIIINYENILSFESKDGAIFEGQTLFIRGEKSNYIQDKDRSQMLKMFPNMQLETILGAGHWLHAEKPKEFIDLVKEFLKE